MKIEDIIKIKEIKPTDQNKTLALDEYVAAKEVLSSEEILILINKLSNQDTNDSIRKTLEKIELIEYIPGLREKLLIIKNKWSQYKKTVAQCDRLINDLKKSPEEFAKEKNNIIDTVDNGEEKQFVESELSKIKERKIKLPFKAEELRSFGVHATVYPGGRYTYIDSSLGENKVWEIFNLLDQDTQKKFWDNKNQYFGLWYIQMLRLESLKKNWEIKSPTKKEFLDYINSVNINDKNH